MSKWGMAPLLTRYVICTGCFVSKAFLQLLDHRRETAIESDHQPGGSPGVGSGVRVINHYQLFFTDHHRLFHKHVFTGIQGA
jgi:hypothetical protein